MDDLELAMRRSLLLKQCDDYKYVDEGYQCQHYGGEGVCKRDDYFMCVVWLRKNPELAQRARDAEDEKRRAQPRSNVVLLKPAPAESSPSTTAPVSTALSVAAQKATYDTSPTQGASRTVLEHPELLTPEAVDELKSRFSEVKMTTASGMDVHLVSAYTDQDRCELTFRGARTLLMIMQIFPDSALISLSKTLRESEKRK
jgi:hypothetical protein